MCLLMTFPALKITQFNFIVSLSSILVHHALTRRARWLMSCLSTISKGQGQRGRGRGKGEPFNHPILGDWREDHICLYDMYLLNICICKRSKTRCSFDLYFMKQSCFFQVHNFICDQLT